MKIDLQANLHQASLQRAESAATRNTKSVETTQRELADAANQFESLLLGELFKVMRKTVPESSMMGGSMGQDIYTSMLDEELSKATSGSMGIADAIVRQLSGPTPAPGTGEVYGVASDEAHAMLTDGGWRAPLADVPHRVSPAQSFGAERPGQRPEDCGGGHCGVDLARPTGTEIYAPRDGTVTRINHDPDKPGGMAITMRHGKITTRYLHLSAISDAIRVGGQVQTGSALGEVGNTGPNSRGAHLHFELSYDGPRGPERIDPEPYLQGWRGGGQ